MIKNVKSLCRVGGGGAGWGEERRGRGGLCDFAGSHQIGNFYSLKRGCFLLLMAYNPMKGLISLF